MKKLNEYFDIVSTMFEDFIKAELTVANAKMENKYFKRYTT